MSVTLPSRHQLIQTVEELPADLLPEVAAFFDYLRFRANKSTSESRTNEEQHNSSSSFLRAITGLGASTEGDISIRDEEILANELDPIRGWTTAEKDQA